MNYFQQGAHDARVMLKVGDILSTTLGRKLVSNTIQGVLNEDGKPRMVRTLEPYYREFVLGEEDPFRDFQYRVI